MTFLRSLVSVQFALSMLGYLTLRNAYDTTVIETYKKDMSRKIDEIGEFEFWIPKKAILKWDGMGGVMVKM